MSLSQLIQSSSHAAAHIALYKAAHMQLADMLQHLLSSPALCVVDRDCVMTTTSIESTVKTTNVSTS